MTIDIHQAKDPLDKPIDCEWCGDKASFKLQCGSYRRYACGNVWHRAKLHRLARLDGYSSDDYEVSSGEFTRRSM